MSRTPAQLDILIHHTVIHRNIAQQELNRANTLLSNLVMEKHNIKKNTIVRNKDTGATYRIDKGYATDAHRLVLYGYRTYSTGRREATSSTHIDLSSVTIISTPQD